MIILGINGSPRKGGNTEIILDRVLDGAREKGASVEKIVLSKLNFSPCLECENIKDDGSCIVEDDMQLVYKKIDQADVVIIASPIFFGSLSAQTKMMIDRFQCLWRAKYILKKAVKNKRKKGIFLSVEASHRKDFFENAKAIIRNLFATIGIEYSEELFLSGIDEKGSILKHEDALKEAFELGKRIV